MFGIVGRMTYRQATRDDCPRLAELNHQLIQDEGHRSRMTVPELEQRMRDWLADEYVATVFEDGGEVVAYALFRERTGEIYLRQLFVVRHRRRQGIGRHAVQTLRSSIWPKDRRLTVEVLATNRDALAFWRAVGYADYSFTLEILPKQSSPVLRQLASSEADSGYAVYLAAFRWLNDQGIRQWLVPQQRDIFDRRQERGENYGLFIGGDLAVVLSLVQSTPAEWADVISERETWWLHNLATAQNFRGRRLGEGAVRMACERLVVAGVNVIYLDCVDVAGFLPAFYERLGFEKVTERNIAYPSGNSFPMVLMRSKDPRGKPRGI
jgi:ribosomal protein S18 acetylase RimI-like enzyme